MSRFFGMVRRYNADLAALLVVIIWGTNFVFQKAALAEFDVFAFNFLRFSGMLALGWAIVLIRGKVRAGQSDKEPTPKIRRADIPRMAVVGVLGYTLYIQLSSVGLNFTTAFSSSLLIATSPIFAALLLWWLKMERIAWGQWLAMFIALLGVTIFLLDKVQIGLQAAGWGDLISLAAAFFWAAYNVANKPLLARYPSSVLTVYTLSFGVIPALLLSLPALLGQDWSRVSLAGWSSLFWSMVFPVYFAWTVWGWVNAKMGVARTAVFMYLVPLVGGITSWLLLNESFGVQKITGAILIIGSLALVRYQASRKNAAKETEKVPEITTQVKTFRA